MCKDKLDTNLFFLKYISLAFQYASPHCYGSLVSRNPRRRTKQGLPLGDRFRFEFANDLANHTLRGIHASQAGTRHNGREVFGTWPNLQSHRSKSVKYQAEIWATCTKSHIAEAIDGSNLAGFGERASMEVKRHTEGRSI